MKRKGIVYLVGAGPGDPELITEKGMRLLRTCEVVVYDRLVSPRLLEETLETCERINVGKIVGNRSITQEEINQILVAKALEGKKVVRLKGGDPFVFGRGGEEVLALNEEEIPFEVVPGVTSAIAVPAYVGIPVTHRGVSQSFHVITGYTITTESGVTDQFDVFAKLEGTLVFLMGMAHLSKIVEGLIQHGKDPLTPVAIISNGTTPMEQSIRGQLQEICEIANKSGIKPPAIIIIGEVAKLDLRYLGNEQLISTKIGITATKALTNKMKSLLQGYGAHVIDLCVSTLKVYDENSDFIEALKNIKAYQWIAFMSTHAVEIFFEKVKENDIDYRNLNHIHFAVVGTGTKEALRKQGFIADYMPTTYTAKALGEGLREVMEKTDKLLIPRAERGSQELLLSLQEAHIAFDDIKTYDIVMEKERLREELSGIEHLDYIIFASSSGVEHFIEGNPIKAKLLLEKAKIVCLGEPTANTLRQYGYTHLLIANPYTAEGVVETIMADKERDND